MRKIYGALKFSFQLIYRSSKFQILLFFFFRIISDLTILASVYLFKDILNSLVSFIDLKNLFFESVLPYILVLVISQLSLTIMSICYESIVQKADREYSCNIMKILSESPISYLDTSSGRDTVAEVKFLKSMVINLPNQLFHAITSVVTFIISMRELIGFNYNVIALFMIFTIPGIICRFYFQNKEDQFRIKKSADTRKFSYYRWVLTDSLPAKDVRMYNLADDIKERYNEEKSYYIKDSFCLDRNKSFFSFIAELFIILSEIIFTYFVVGQALDGNILIGDVALYIGLIGSASASFQNLAGSFLHGIVNSSKNIQKAICFFTTSKGSDESIKRSIEGFSSIVFDNVYFKYPLSDKYVLSGISFTLNKGDRLSIIGVNGSGKSTIIKLMLGFYQVDSGRILINGYSLYDYDIVDVRRMFSVLFQAFVQYPLSLKDNIVLGDYEKHDNDVEIINAMKKSGIYSEIMPKVNNDINRSMTRRFDDYGIELSKGQWQKLALARTYFKNAPIIILDEPSASLDAKAEDDIFENFKNISSSKTGIMISHRISSSKIANKIIVINDGKVVEQGTHSTLLALNGLYAKLYNLQKEKYMLKNEQ